MKCCDLYAGKLRNKISLEREVVTPDGFGGSSHVWVEIKTFRAYIKPVSGSERLHSQRLEASMSHKVFIRYNNDIMPTDRINYNGRFFQIRAVINIEERNKWLELVCEEGVAQ